jgi:hypothetical protein
MGKVELVALSVTPLTLLGLFSMKERILEYRISRGFYGSNTAEARDLIQFIIEHGDRIDFNDGSGLRRPSLVSYPDDCAARRTRVPAGATAK